MIDMIGLLIATAIFFALAAMVSAILAGCTWLLLRKKEVTRIRLAVVVVTATLIPLFSAAYMWLCVALLPGESLFGDISQRLPNGYVIKALGKMPDFASISNSKSPYSDNGLSEYVGKLAVYGPFVAGQYSHPFSSFEAEPNEPFFIFDTRKGQTINLPTRVDLENRLGHPVILTEVPFFRSQESSYRDQQNINRLIMFGPPIIALGILIVFSVRLRSRTQPRLSNIYT